MKKDNLPSPISWIKRFPKNYPNGWKRIETARSRKGTSKSDSWPDWCYCPLSKLVDEVTLHEPFVKIRDGKIIYDKMRINLVNRLQVLGTWKQTQGIYRLDEVFFNHLVKTPIAGEIPVEILYYLPEWCVYVQFPDNNLFMPKAKGFFALLDYDSTIENPILVIYIDYDYYFSTNSLNLKGDIKNSFNFTRTFLEGLGNRVGVPSDEHKKLLNPQQNEEGTENLFSPIISILLYLCSESADIKDREGKKPSLVKSVNPSLISNLSTLPVYTPTIWEVGFRVGPILNPLKQQSSKKDLVKEDLAKDSLEQVEHSSPKPHVRRAHWHGYWVGSKEEKKFILKWLHPILVNTQHSDNIISTERKVL